MARTTPTEIVVKVQCKLAKIGPFSEKNFLFVNTFRYRYFSFPFDGFHFPLSGIIHANLPWVTDILVVISSWYAFKFNPLQEETFAFFPKSLNNQAKVITGGNQFRPEGSIDLKCFLALFHFKS